MKPFREVARSHLHPVEEVVVPYNGGVGFINMVSYLF